MKTLLVISLALALVGCGNQTKYTAASQTQAAEALRPGDSGYPFSAAKLDAIKAEALGPSSPAGTSEVRAAVGGLYVLAKAVVLTNNCVTPKLIYGPNFQTGYGDYGAAMFLADALSKSFYEALRIQYGNCPASTRANELRWAQVSATAGEIHGYLKAFNGFGSLVATYWF